MAKTSLIWKITDEEFKTLIDTCKTYTEILARFGLMNRGNNHKTVKRRIDQLGLNFKSVGYNLESNLKKKKPISFYLKRGIKVSNSYLKKRLIKEGLLKDECAICGLTNVWNGNPLSLQLDHKNGDSTDNRIENLRLVCPNCHSQTETYCGKAKKSSPKICKKCGKILNRKNKSFLCKKCGHYKTEFIQTKPFIKKPDKIELEKLVGTMPVTEIGKKYEVSANAVLNWLKNYGIKNPGRGFWTLKKRPPREELQKLSNMSSTKIAKLYNVFPGTVLKWFKLYNIKRPIGSFWVNKRWNKGP